VGASCLLPGRACSTLLGMVVTGQVYIMGSYKLNVHEPAADIDICCVGPSLITREDFFLSFYEVLR
jgi:poly(A) polymerase Pap1